MSDKMTPLVYGSFLVNNNVEQIGSTINRGYYNEL